MTARPTVSENARAGGVYLDDLAALVEAGCGQGRAFEKGTKGYASVDLGGPLLTRKWGCRAHTDTVKLQGPKKEPRIEMLDTSVFPEWE